MPVIDLVELYYVSADLPAPFEPAWVPGSKRMRTGFYLIRIATEDGVEGWSGFSASGKERRGRRGVGLLRAGREAREEDADQGAHGAHVPVRGPACQAASAGQEALTPGKIP